MLCASRELDQTGQTLGWTKNDSALDCGRAPLGGKALQPPSWLPPTFRTRKGLARNPINLNLEGRLNEFGNHLKFQLPPGHSPPGLDWLFYLELPGFGWNCLEEVGWKRD